MSESVSHVQQQIPRINQGDWKKLQTGISGDVWVLRRNEDAQEAVSVKVVFRFSMKKETNWTWILRKYTELSCETSGV